MALVVLVLCGILFSGIKAEEDALTSLKKPEIHSLHISSDIRYRFATTLVTSRIKNVDTKSREAMFDVTLPNEAFITNLTLEIDGKIIIGEIKQKEVAKKQYEEAKRRGESAGYIGTRHRETNRFNLAVTVAPQNKVSFNLTYQELLKRTHGHYEQVIYIDPGQPVPDMDITVSIIESREITDLKVPPLRNDVMADIEDLSTVTVISRPTSRTANVKFVPSIEFQTAQSVSGMAGQFVVQYDVEREMDLGDILMGQIVHKFDSSWFVDPLSWKYQQRGGRGDNAYQEKPQSENTASPHSEKVVNGYFVHFFAPDGFKPIPNDVLFILDTSGSMTGKKLEQLKDAMQSVLMQLNEGDRMNIMTFSGSTSFWKTEMVDIMDEDTMEEAKSHISSLKAGGWTNINLALTSGITFLKDRTHSDGAIRSPVVLFLTDGEATQGVTGTEQILKNVRSVNEEDFPVFTLAFGEYADYDIVKKISIQNNGLARKIYEASDAAMQIAGFYNEIAVTLLNNISFHYLDAPVANVTKHEYSNYFNGSEMVISGRLEMLDDLSINNVLRMKIIGNSVDGPDLVLTGEMSDNLVDLGLTDNFTMNEDFEKITEKVWAYLTIKQLLEQELAASNEEKKLAYKNQILDLSLKYGFVTPLTSMVVTLPTAEIADEETLINAEEHPELQRHSHQSQRLHAIRSSFLQKGLGTLALDHVPRMLGGSTYRRTNSGARYSGYMASLPPQYDVGMSKFGAADVIQQRKKPSKKDRRQRRKNKRKNLKRRGFQYPLQVKFPNLKEPMCFNMFDEKLDNSPGRYILYSNSVEDLKVEVQLEKTIIGKWTKQGSIKEIHLISGDRHDILTKDTFSSRTVFDVTSPWEVIYSPVDSGVPASEIIVKLKAFDIMVKANDDGYLHVIADRSTKHGSLSGDGIIGQVMSKQVQVIRINSNGPAKKNRKGKMKRRRNTALLKVGASKFVAILRDLGSSGENAGKCWSLKRNEDEMLDVKVARVI